MDPERVVLPLGAPGVGDITARIVAETLQTRQGRTNYGFAGEEVCPLVSRYAIQRSVTKTEKSGHRRWMRPPLTSPSS
jgi:hypothetical protein